MTFMDSLTISLIGLAVVFLVLIMLSVLIQVQSVVLGYITSPHRKLVTTGSNRTDTRNALAEETAVSAELPEKLDKGWSTGELKLLGVDEKTAAMIMAIVSHESKIPLSELQFKMIKAID